MNKELRQYIINCANHGERIAVFNALEKHGENFDKDKRLTNVIAFAVKEERWFSSIKKADELVREKHVEGTVVISGKDFIKEYGYVSKTIETFNEFDGIKVGDVWADKENLNQFVQVMSITHTIHYYHLQQCKMYSRHISDMKKYSVLIERDGEPVEVADADTKIWERVDMFDQGKRCRVKEDFDGEWDEAEGRIYIAKGIDGYITSDRNGKGLDEFQYCEILKSE